MSLAEQVAVFAAGAFFMVGLACGVWKYGAITRSSNATAPVYVDVAHRAALLYAFACLVVERFAALSTLDPGVELVAVVVQVGFFALALSTYVVHGLLRDTDNQLRRPHALGRRELAPGLVHGFMITLIVAELGGFALLFWGAATAP
jgi:hypothetical protein